MKTLLFRMLGAAMILAAGIMLPSCSKDKNNPKPEPEPTSKNTLSVAPSTDITFEASGSADITLTVTTDADDWYYETPAWMMASRADNKLIVNATNNTGNERKGSIKFTAGTAPAVTVNVTQKGSGGTPPDPSTHPSLTGSAYIVLLLDPVTYSSIQSKVLQDLRVNEKDMFIDIWSGTMNAIALNGPNFYNLTAGGTVSWFAVSVVDGQGWSGGGQSTRELRTNNPVTMGDEFGDDWYFHMAVKSNGQPHGFKIWGAGATGETTASFKFGIGGQYYDAGQSETYPDRFSSIRMNGDWQEYEIPVKEMTDAGWLPWNNNNLYLYSFISGGVGGRTLELDAIFFYKK